MISRSLIKSAIDDWLRWFDLAKQNLIPRRVEVIWPKGMALALIGVRRSGKTFLAIETAMRLAPHVLYFNFEDPIFLENNDASNLDTIVSVYTEYSGHEPGVIVFDEIHNIAGWERWVRKMVDTGRWPIIITGSSAKLLSSEIATSIAGRCVECQLWPLSFAEYLTFSQTVCSSPDSYLAAMRLYLMRGGFPAVIRETDDVAKGVILQQYLVDIVMRDVINRHEIRTKRSLDQVVLFAMTNLASLFSYQSMRRAFGMTADVVQDYVGFLEEAFLLFEVSRFHPNLKVQSRDPKKIYVIDTGLRNVHARSQQEDIGKLAENVVYIELRRRAQEIYYFKDQGEVDFIITEQGKPMQAIQVCYSDMADESTLRREIDSLNHCLVKLKLESGMILTLNREEIVPIHDKKIRLIPLYKYCNSATEMLGNP